MVGIVWFLFLMRVLLVGDLKIFLFFWLIMSSMGLNFSDLFYKGNFFDCFYGDIYRV